MMTLIIGGSGSGKSAYAEEYTASLSEGCNKYYLATMQVFDKEGWGKIERHRMLRSGKGFATIEQQTSICQALEKMKQPEQESDRTALLECISNLVANEMFGGEVQRTCELITEKIIGEVEQLNRGLKHLVIVTNNVFEDGNLYDETTMEYIKAMGGINERLAAMADQVIEVVVGIPLIVK